MLNPHENESLDLCSILFAFCEGLELLGGQAKVGRKHGVLALRNGVICRTATSKRDVIGQFIKRPGRGGFIGGFRGRYSPPGRLIGTFSVHGCQELQVGQLCP